MQATYITYRLYNTCQTKEMHTVYAQVSSRLFKSLFSNYVQIAILLVLFFVVFFFFLLDPTLSSDKSCDAKNSDGEVKNKILTVTIGDSDS